MIYEDKESKVMMKILTENKKKVRGHKVRAAIAKEKAQDILGCVWICAGFMVAVGIISLLI